MGMSYFFKPTAVHHPFERHACVCLVAVPWRLMYKGSIAVEKDRLLNLGDGDVGLLGEAAGSKLLGGFQRKFK